MYLAIDQYGRVEILQGFLKMFDGEKDPRNLHICFKALESMVLNFSKQDIDLMASELFEATACYYPIMFNPPKDDPHHVKPEDLAFVLR